MSTIGFIGLGRMGGAMATRLAAHGHDVLGYDPSAPARAVAQIQGARLAPDIKAVADQAEVILLSLPQPPVVIDAVLGNDGVAQGGAVKLCVDLSTSGPKVARDLAEGLAKRGIGSLEAPVSGGIKGAREGTLALMCSGPRPGFERAREHLDLLGRPFYLGEAAGAGQMMKLVNNLLGACAIAITAEGMTLGVKAGLDPARMIEVLNVSSGRSSATQDKWPRAVLPRTFDFGFAAGLCLKDVKLCLDAAGALSVPTPLGAQVAALLERTVTALGADADFTAMAQVVENDAGLNPARPA